ncbi:acylphosphatase [Planctomicrobium sp. SH661]|uniref:acylphosphatase n=1 Tax=Planctomicrobium sp. SH661 TaxID=3448124 RepID=UPI003F5B9305
MTAQQRWHVIYHGRVQGVGFRQTVWRIARRHPVVGTVRNLPDRTVELIAEGEEQGLQSFHAAIEMAFRRNIDQADLKVQTPTGEFTTFEILT